MFGFVIHNSWCFHQHYSSKCCNWYQQKNKLFNLDVCNINQKTNRWPPTQILPFQQLISSDQQYMQLNNIYNSILHVNWVICKIEASGRLMFTQIQQTTSTCTSPNSIILQYFWLKWGGDKVNDKRYNLHYQPRNWLNIYEIATQRCSYSLPESSEFIWCYCKCVCMSLYGIAVFESPAIFWLAIHWGCIYRLSKRNKGDAHIGRKR